MTPSLKRKEKIQGKGIAVFKLIGYFKNAKDADQFIQEMFDYDDRLGSRFRIYKKEKTMLWGTEYDKPTLRGNSP